MVIAGADTYCTDPERKRPFFSRLFLSPLFTFYPQYFWIIYWNGRKALKGSYGHQEWADSSRDVMQALENVGVRFEITGMDNLRGFDGPAVFISNHMSTLETMVLPCIIQPVKSATFIVKESLITMPFFGPIMRSRDPVVVGRVNPREDLRAVLEKGSAKLRSGMSIIIFPQSTRTSGFNPADFNSLGIKLASRAGVPVVPIALKTDAWGIGRFIKDFGPINRDKKVYIRFGEPMVIAGRGADEHDKIVAFIQDNLRGWSGAEGRACGGEREA
ncbi:MAG: lysophospholipid acyltransferase family protein [Thermodesulfovibrionales bacterium]